MLVAPRGDGDEKPLNIATRAGEHDDEESGAQPLTTSFEAAQRGGSAAQKAQRAACVVRLARC